MEKLQNHSLSLRKLIEDLESRNQESGTKDLYNIRVSNNNSLILDAVEVKGITQDSRNVKPGYLFAALKGANFDGTQFIDAAIEKGAVAILSGQLPDASDQEWKVKNPEICFLSHSNPKLALAQIAANFYQEQPETIVAITGTNGKTSCAYFCTQLWQLLGINSASIGTIGIVSSKGLAYGATGSMTTPDPIKLHEILADLSKNGVTNLAMEASSHGLDQYRLDGVNVKAAAFTNLTRDHLDYHGTLENYLAAKLRLFEVMKNGVAVINSDIPESTEIIKLCEQQRHKIWSVGKKGNYIKIIEIKPSRIGQKITFEIEGKICNIDTHLIGEFQAYNLLTAVALVVACGADFDEVLKVLSDVEAVPGRMQGVGFCAGNHVPGAGKGNELPEALPRIYVDYAHTPDALEKALLVLKPYSSSGKLWVIFGCGGDRDKGKRPQMGAVAANLADVVVVTDDNPRSEVPEVVRSEIMAVCKNALEIGDRAEAISYAIKNMAANDVLLIAGKGHEKTQIIGDKKLPFDDVEIARQNLINNVKITIGS